MLAFTPFFSLLALVATTTASAIPVAFEPRDATTCGSNVYTAAQVSAASQKAYSYYQSGSAPGSYPHTYHNYEGFTFPVAGPYQEFPILASHELYTGGSPGADRVIINTSGQQAGAITHTGASGDNFVGCSGTS